MTDRRLSLAILAEDRDGILQRLERIERDMRELLGRITGLETNTLGKPTTVPGGKLDPRQYTSSARQTAERAFAKLTLGRQSAPSGDDRDLAGTPQPATPDGPSGGSPGGSNGDIEGRTMAVALNQAARQAMAEADWEQRKLAERKRIEDLALRPPSIERTLPLHGPESALFGKEAGAYKKQQRLAAMQAAMDAPPPPYTPVVREHKPREIVNGGSGGGSASSHSFGSSPRAWK